MITDVVTQRSFVEDTVNAGPQIIDGGVSLTDTDSANFDGGRLWVSAISGYGDILQAQLPENLVAQDQLGIRNQGTGVGQVGVSGSNISYGGTLIGSVVLNGANGSDLVVQFNASASAQAVEALIENLTYRNTSSAPVANRTISISVSDGDGGTSVPRTVQIEVTPSYDGAQPLYGNEQVNTYSPDTQTNAAMAALTGGGYVTVWQSSGQDGWAEGIHGQRFDANGVPVGSEFQVNSYTPYAQVNPAVATLSGGGYVVMWQSQYQDGGGTYGVHGQRFDGNGVPQGTEFLVNTTTDYDQSDVSVSGVPGGGFVATWVSYYQNGDYYDIYAQRFDAAGAKTGSEFKVNTDATHYQSEPSITTLASGQLVVTWTSSGQDGASYGIYGQRYDATGNALGSEFLVNTQTDDNQSAPSVVALTGGGFVVVWQSYQQDSSGWGVFGQRYNASGVAQGGEFRVNTEVSGNEYEASVTALSSGGFAVAFRDDNRTVLQQFDANGLRVDGPAVVDSLDNNANASLPVVLGLNNGAVVVSWTDYDYSAAGGDNTYQVFQQLFGPFGALPRQANPQLVDVAETVTFAENTVNATPQLIDPGVGLFDADSANFDGGVLEVNYLTDYGAQDQLGLQGLDKQDQLGIRHQGNGAGQVGVSGNTVSFAGTAIGTLISNGANGEKLTVQFNANAAVESVERVIENLTYANTVSNPIGSRTVSIRVSDGDGGASEARAVQINVTPEVDGAVAVGLERVVNTTRGGQQAEPSVAKLASGGYVVVWEDQSGNDGTSYGVYGQRYDANDNAVGNEFRVNTTTVGTQYEAQVTGLTGGGYVVTWRSDGQDGNGAGVYAQRYNADGSSAGSEFRVNTETVGNQYQPEIAATTDGGFVVTWYHDYYSAANTEYGDVFFQRYNASGVAQGGETRANPPLGGTFLYQSQPSIAWNADGSGFVVVWTDNSIEGSNGIYGQRFNGSGAAQGGSFHVNTYTTSSQEHASVAALKGGGFVVVWESEGQDLSGTGVYGQRFDGAGAKVGSEFRINTHISSTQDDPHVVASDNGGWVVTWSDNSNPLDNSGWGVFAQQYNAAGQAIDGELRVNSYPFSTQNQPAITAMADGGFVVAYAGYVASYDGNGDGVPDGGNDTMEIRVQRFSNTAPVITDVAVNAVEETAITLTYALFASGFNDPDGQALQAVKIVTLPTDGALRLNGSAVTAGQEIALADLQAGALSYLGQTDFFGLAQFRWTGSDGIAFAATPVFTNINVQNLNDGPRLEAGTTGNGVEGSTFSHSITLGDPDPEGHQLSINWGDGTAVQVYNVGNATDHTISHVYYENATYTVQVTANDQQGQANSSETDSFQVVVANAAPTISLSGAASVVQGELYTLDLGTPSDPANNAGPVRDTVSEYRINWGDGSAVQVFTAASLPANGIVTHTFASSGNPTLSVTLVDEDGVHANAGSKAVSVSAPAEVLTVDAGADIAVNEGAFFQKTIAFTDPTDTNANGRSYSVNWGDGQSSNGTVSAGLGSFNINHTYADGSNSYSVSVLVNDDGAQQGSDAFNVTVNNLAPTVSVSGAGSVNEGGLYTVNLSKNDAGSDTASQYTVHWGDGSADTVLSAATLAAQSGNVTHTYADGSATRNISVDVIDEDGTWLAAGNSSVFVANVAPTAPVSGAATVNEGSVYTLSVGSITEPGTDTRSAYSINWGDGQVSSLTPAQWLAAAGSFTHTYADGAAGRTITVSATDEDGTFTLGTQALTVNNVAPTVSATGAASTNEGAVYTLAVAATDPAGASDTLSYSINWGDGSATQTLTAAQLAAVSGNVTHVFADDQDGPVNSTPRTITVTASDEDGGIGTQTVAVAVNNVAPDVDATGASTATTGVAYTLNLANLVDPGTDTLLANGISINWGDGSTTTHSAIGNISHTYAAAGTPTINVSLADEDGSYSNVATLAITVNPPTSTVSVNAGADVVLSEGDTFSRTVTFSDGQDNGSAGWSYSIDYGDGTVQSGSTLVPSVALSHVYADGSASRTATLTVTDVAGESASDSFVVTVNNVAPTAAVSGAATVNEGSVYTLSVGTITEPGTDTRSAYSISWGDGQVSSLTPAQWLAAAGSFTHTYADGAAGRTITVSATDEDGTFTLGTQALTVNNVAPTVSATGAASTNEGAVYTLAVAATDPAGASDTLSYSINWGDGSATQTLTAAQLAAVSGNVTHVFADDQDGPVNSTPRTITVTASDEDGGIGTQTVAVAVNNVAPDVDATGASTATTGVAYTLNLANLVDPGTDTLLANGISINWGDGSTTTHSAIGNISHTYAAAGTPTINVSLADEDGSYSNVATLAITVNPPTSTVSVNAGADVVLSEGDTFSRTVTFSDGQDNGSAGWSYSIDYGDGTVQSGSTLVPSVALSHVYADGSASRTATLMVTDVAGESASDSFAVTVNNVAPTAPVSGAATVNEGSVYTLSVGTIVEPGTDTRSAYSINWGDGQVSSLTPAQWLAAAGSFTHTYADGAAGRTITVSATDEDGTFTLGTQTLTVNNVAPTVSATGAAATNEGAVYTLAVSATDPAGASDTLSYSINWGDGSATQTLTAAQLAAVSGNVTHVFADDQDGPINSTPRTITVTASDEDGGIGTQTVAVAVNNVAPDVDASGASTATTGVAYTLNLANLVDPGTDTLLANGISINWGDGSTTTHSAIGNISHTYAAAGTPTINVSLADEDGSYANVATLAITVNQAGGGNVAPVAGDDHYAVQGSQTLTVPALSGLLANDSDGNAADVLTVTSVNSTGLQGSVNVGANGQFTFTANAGFVGTTSFSYSVSDGAGGSDTGQVNIDVAAVPTQTVRVGDAPVRQSGTGGQWAAAWSNTLVDVLHKADYTSGTEAWSATAAHAVNPQLLSGGDIYQGDLGVSGQSIASSSVRQELDGKEALRFNLDQEATEVTVNLSRFYLNDDGGLYAESGLLRLRDAAGNVVGETAFHANATSGALAVTLAAAEGFSSVELLAGAYNGSEFAFGAYSQANGSYGAAAGTDAQGRAHGSDFSLDWIEFDFPVIGVQPDPPL